MAQCVMALGIEILSKNVFFVFLSSFCGCRVKKGRRSIQLIKLALAFKFLSDESGVQLFNYLMGVNVVIATKLFFSNMSYPIYW